jgi:crotonobetainyl-CoA:carnitine CoA-transferase CaiB-like acyl-CoA transferase
MTVPSSTAPLAEIRVIEFGHYIAGPVAGMLLSDQGANVVKIDPPSDPALTSPEDAVYNRGKKRISLDLKQKADAGIARNLIRDADVLIENFRPGVRERLGLGAEAMTAENPRLVYLSMPGFASSDPVLGSLPAWEGTMGAACGLYTDVNILRTFLGLPPVYSALPHASVYGAIHGALAVVMALCARENTGLGDIIEVPLVSAGMSAMGGSLLHIPDQPQRYDIPRIPRLLRRLALPMLHAMISRAKPAWRERVSNRFQPMVPAFMSSYRCKDDRLLYLFAIDHVRTAVQLLEFLGLKEDLQARGLMVEDSYSQSHPGQNLADSSNLSRKWQREIKNALAMKFRQKPAEDWEAELNTAGITCAVQRTTEEWLALDPPFKAKVTVEIDDPRYGLMRQLGLQAWVDGSPAELADPEPAHRLDQDREEILTLAKGKRRKVSAPVRGAEHAPPLQGLKVLDLCSMIAGPVCARTLAEYGADVIKIVSPHPLHGPRMTCWYGIDVDQGKRSLLLDLKTDAGKAVLRRLIERADVLVHNFSRDAVKRLGLRYEDVKKINPRIIYCAVSAFDGPAEGPWAGRKGYDPVAQAATGIMTRYGSRGHPEHHAIASCVDYLSGYAAAFAVALGVLTRTRDPRGHGTSVKTSLAQSAQLIQVPFAFRFQGRNWSEPHGQHALGDHPLHRMYRASDGWLFLAARPDQTKKLLMSLGLDLSVVQPESRDAISAAFGRAFRRRPVAEWARRLRSHNIAVVRVESLREIRERMVEHLPKTEFITGGPTIQIVRQDHPVGCPVDTVAPAYARLRRSPVRRVAQAPKPGTHTIEILSELGYTESEKSDLQTTGVVAEALSSSYLPD